MHEHIETVQRIDFDRLDKLKEPNMSLFAWIKNQGECALALALFVTATGIAVAGLAYGLEGLAAAVAGSLALWLGPWPRLARALGRRIDGWLFGPEPPKLARYAHERAPRRIRRQAPAHLLPYDRLKVRYGEHVAALLVFASGMGVLIAAAAVWVLGAEWGLNNPGSKAAATLLFGGIGVFSLWRPDVEWNNANNECYEDFTDELHYRLLYQGQIVNVYHRDDCDD